MEGIEYVDLDAARQELGGLTGFNVTVGGIEYEFPETMNGDAYLTWMELLVAYLKDTGIAMSEWRPELGIPLPLQTAWLESALSPDQLAQMRADGLNMGQINSVAEYLYMRYIGVPPPNTEGDGTEADPIRSLQPSSSSKS